MRCLKSISTRRCNKSSHTRGSISPARSRPSVIFPASVTPVRGIIGFAPADHPKIAVAVFVRHGGRTGGDISAPIAKSVIQAYLQGQGG